jgi:hypothetical protein
MLVWMAGYRNGEQWRLKGSWAIGMKWRRDGVCAEVGEGGRERERLLVSIKTALAAEASCAKIAREVGCYLSGHPVAKTASEFGILKQNLPKNLDILQLATASKLHRQLINRQDSLFNAYAMTRMHGDCEVSERHEKSLDTICITSRPRIPTTKST